MCWLGTDNDNGTQIMAAGRGSPPTIGVGLKTEMLISVRYLFANNLLSSIKEIAEFMFIHFIENK